MALRKSQVVSLIILVFILLEKKKLTQRANLVPGWLVHTTHLRGETIN